MAVACVLERQQKGVQGSSHAVLYPESHEQSTASRRSPQFLVSFSAGRVKENLCQMDAARIKPTSGRRC